MKIKIIQYLRNIEQLQDGLSGEQLSELLKLLKIDPLEIIYSPEKRGDQ